MLPILHLQTLLPEVGDVFFVTFADGTLVIIAQALLGPEGTLSLQVYLVSAEKWCLLELARLTIIII